MTESGNIEQLKIDLRSDDRSVALRAADMLGKELGQAGHVALIEALSDPAARHFAALGIHEGRVQAALDPLFNLIKDPMNLGRTGTLVFALESLDCREKIEDLFDVMFIQRYESHISAASILYDQTFSVSAATGQRIRRKWELVQSNPSACPDFDAKRKDIQALIQRHLASE